MTEITRAQVDGCLKALGRYYNGPMQCEPTHSDHVIRTYITQLEARVGVLEGLVKSVCEWNQKYPSSRIYGEWQIRIIAKEMDAINEKCLEALAGKDAL